MESESLRLAGIHLDLLYVRDAAGLILRSRDPSVTAPLVHLVRTTHGNRWFLSSLLTDCQRSQV